ncbi:MAG: SWIM zinc finger family protein [Chloroflexi bacterium]|nr:SWIM zinc finger family protein [Chloroflexota bacterium]OJV87035.1 MAG: hypothetical protein BGO39_33260 [Chloroflexi bacterium 54-19]
MPHNHWSGWDDRPYYEPSSPREVKNGLKTKSERGTIGETWWSKRWIGTLESFDMGTRLTRGRSYARKGQVVSLDVEPGTVKAKVQGSAPRPYKVEIGLPPLTDTQWEAVTDAMAGQALFAAKLLAGEMPQNIEEAFKAAKVSLFPKSSNELETDCSCPDWANPCKHIAAVYYLMADRFDEDPFLIFKLRGRTKEALIAALREKRSAFEDVEAPDEPVIPGLAAALEAATTPPQEEVKPLEDCLDNFWQSGESLSNFRVNLEPPEVENAVLKRLGEAPFKIGKQNLTELLEPAYKVARKVAEDKKDLL